MLGNDSTSRRTRAILAVVLYGYAIGLAYTAQRYLDAYPAYDTTLDIISIVTCVVISSAIFGHLVGTRHLRPCQVCEIKNAELPHTLCRECATVAKDYLYYEAEATNERRYFHE